MTATLTRQEIKHIVESIDNKQIARMKHIVLFVGHAHSGHSIIGALLDAHQDVAISNEINVPKLMYDHDISKSDLLKIILYYSQSNHQVWHNTEYKYNVPKGHQGQTRLPLVVGDKKGGGTTRVLMNHPELLVQLKDWFGKNLKIIHTLRNPIDNISAFAYYWKEPLAEKHIQRYFENLSTVLTIKQAINPRGWFTIKQEVFLKDPKTTLSHLFDFLQLEYTTEQIDSYTSIVDSNIASKKTLYEWGDDLLEMIEKNKHLYDAFI